MYFQKWYGGISTPFVNFLIRDIYGLAKAFLGFAEANMFWSANWRTWQTKLGLRTNVICHELRLMAILQRSISLHFYDVIIRAMASQTTSLKIVYSTVYSGTNQVKHQSSASLAFVWGIHRWLVKSPHKGPVTRKMFPFDNVIIMSS